MKLNTPFFISPAYCTHTPAAHPRVQVEHREGDTKQWYTVLVTALGSSGKPVLRDHAVENETLKGGLRC
jgi:hypothetical protein